MKKTLLNYRPMMFAAITVMAAALASGGIALENYAMLVVGVVAVAIIMATVIMLYPHKRYFVLVIALIFTVAAVVANYHINTWAGQTRSGEIRLVVTDELEIEDGTVTAVGRDITVGGRRVKGRAELTIKLDKQSMVENISAGDIVIIYSGVLMPVKLVKDGRIDTLAYKKDVRYLVSCKEPDIRRVRSSADLFERARVGIKQLIYRYAPDEDSASVSYAMITGSSAYLGIELKSAYSISGLTHILSASGLHIGFVFVLVGWLMGKLKVGRRYRFWIMAASALAYCMLCAYSVSIVRSAIMGVSLEAGRALGRKSDGLNSLMLSALLIIAVKPVYLFDLSFLLSFSSVLGIVMLYNPLARVISRVKGMSGKVGGKIGSAVAVSLAANIGIFPVMSYYFQTFFVYGIIANLIALPAVNVSFIGLLVPAIAAAFVPPMGLLTVIPLNVVKAINTFALWMSGLPNAEIIVFAAGGAALPYFLYMCASVGLANISKKAKAVAALATAIIIVVTFIPYNVHGVVYARALSAVASRGGAVSLVYNNEGDCAIIGALDNSNRYDIVDSFVTRRQRSAEVLVITNPSVERIEYAARLVRLFGVSRLYVVTEDYALSDEYSARVKGAKVSQVFEGIDYDVMGLIVRGFVSEGTRLGLRVTTQLGLTVIYPSSDSENINAVFSQVCGYVDVVVSRNYISGFRSGLYLVTAGSDGVGSVLSARERGNFTINI